MAGQVLGGGQQRYQGVQPPAPQQEGTLQVLMKMAEPVIQKQLKQEQETAFMKGMQRVATGEAYKDVKSGSESFLNTIFGPSATVQGAASMAQVKAVDDFQAQMFSDMQGHAEMSPSQFREHAVKGMSQFLTGDETVDTVVQTKIVQAMPQLMRTQAKANYAWVQQQNINQYNGMLQAAGNVFGKLAATRAEGALVNEEEWQQAQLGLIQAAQPLPGMDPEAYKKALLQSTTLAMNSGNFWVYRSMQENGMLGHLDVDEQTKLETARVAAETKAKNDIGFNKFGPAIGELVGGAAGRSPKVNHDMANSINERYMRMTGAETGLIDTKDMISMDSRYYSRMYTRQDEMQKLVAKANLDAQAEGRLAQQTLDLVYRGAGNLAVGMGVPKAKVDATFSLAFQSAMDRGSPEQAIGVVNENYQRGAAYVNPQLQSTLTEPFRSIGAGNVPGPEFDRSMEMLNHWRQVPGSQGAIDSYFGTENIIRAERYTSALASGLSKQEAAQAAWGSAITKAPSFNNEEAAPVLDKILTEKFEGKGVANAVTRWINDVPNLTDSGKAMILTAVKEDASAYMSNLGMSMEAALNRSLDGPARRKLDVVGGFVYRKQSPDQQPMAAMVGIDDQGMASLLPTFLQAKAREQGVAVNIEDAKSPLYTDPKGSATPNSNAVDLTKWWGGGKADVTILRSADMTTHDGEKLAVFTSNLSLPGRAANATISFTSDDLKKFYEESVKNRNSLPNILGKSGL